MHPSVYSFVKGTVARYALGDRPVLEVGALNVNGSVRDLFSGEYLATDMRAGLGVDATVNAHQLAALVAPGSFEVIVCCEMLEHDSAPWVSLEQMRYCCKPGGHLILTCRGYDERGCFPVHGYPNDFWRFSVGGVRELLARTGWEPLDVLSDPDPASPGVLALAWAA